MLNLQRMLTQKHDMLKSADKELHEHNAAEVRKGVDALYDQNRTQVLALYAEAKTIVQS